MPLLLPCWGYSKPPAHGGSQAYRGSLGGRGSSSYPRRAARRGGGCCLLYSSARARHIGHLPPHPIG